MWLTVCLCAFLVHISSPPVRHLNVKYHQPLVPPGPGGTGNSAEGVQGLHGPRHGRARCLTGGLIFGIHLFACCNGGMLGVVFACTCCGPHTLHERRRVLCTIVYYLNEEGRFRVPGEDSMFLSWKLLLGRRGLGEVVSNGTIAGRCIYLYVSSSRLCQRSQQNAIATIVVVVAGRATAAPVSNNVA